MLAASCDKHDSVEIADLLVTYCNKKMLSYLLSFSYSEQDLLNYSKQGRACRLLSYVPLGGLHFKAVGSIVLLLPRFPSLVFQSSIRS